MLCHQAAGTYWLESSSVSARWRVWLTAACLLVPSPCAGQTPGSATGVITGTVIDPTRAVLPGVTLVLTSPQLMGGRTARTTDAGSFRFSALPPGTYSLKATLAGFTPVVREAIYVAAGFTATVDVSLPLETVADTVRVERTAAVVDRHATSVATTFDAAQLSSLPGARTMASVLAAAPAVYVSRFDVGGSSLETGSYGAFGTYGANRPMVEGVSVTGISGRGFNLDFGSFEEVSVGTGAHGPEWHSAGVQMQFVSRSGGNQYHGTLYAGYENRHSQSFNIDDEQIARGAAGGGGLAPYEANRLWSYRDVNADSGGYMRRDALWWYFSFRDQDIAARQVNFPVSPLRTRLTNYGGKVTYRASPRHALIGFLQTSRNDQPHDLEAFVLTGTSAINESDESTSRQLSWGWIGKVEWNASLGASSFLELRAGQFGANRSETPHGNAPRFEDVVSLAVRGGNREWQNRYRRHQLLGSFSHFKDRWLGSHQFKGGGEIFLTTEAEIWRRGYPGDVLHVVRSGEPAEVFLFEAPSRSENGLWTYSAHVGDSWRLPRRLTLNLGARIDRYRVFLPGQVHPAGRFNATPQAFAAVDEVIAWNVAVPRIGAAYDLAGNGRTIAKVSYGRYALAPGNLVGANANPNSSGWWRRYSWTDVDGSRRWEPGEERVLLARQGGAAVESLDRGLRLPMVTEAAAWIERELPAGIGLRTGIVWRGASRYFMRVNANRPFSAFSRPVIIADPGPDGRMGTADDGPPIEGMDLPRDLGLVPPVNVVRNVANAASRHWTWEISAMRRYRGRWALMAGFAHVWNGDQAGRYFGQAVRQNSYPVTPNDLIHAGPDGRYDFRTWTAKVHGILDAPWGVRIAPLLRHQSGQPYGRTFATRLEYGTVRVLAEPMGTRRMDNVTLVDARLEKSLRLPGGRRAAVFVDVYNVLNANPEQNLNWSSGDSFRQPLAIVPPRIVRLGARLDW